MAEPNQTAHLQTAPLQTGGRKANAAQPLDDIQTKDGAQDRGGPERYPSAGKDDAVTGPGSANPEPPQGAGDGGPAGKR